LTYLLPGRSVGLDTDDLAFSIITHISRQLPPDVAGGKKRQVRPVFDEPLSLERPFACPVRA